MKSNAAWEDFCAVKLRTCASEYAKLLTTQDDESTPYKSRYRAAEGQAQLASELESFASASSCASLQVHAVDTDVSGDTLKGRLHIRRGFALSETDLTTEAKDSLHDGLAALNAATPCQDVDSKLVALNTLGALLGGAEHHEEALARLTEAEALYQAVKSGKASIAGSEALLRLEGDTTTEALSRIEDAYTRTVFFLAQVHQSSGNTEQSKAYCGATLQRQLLAWGTPPELVVFQLTQAI